MEENEKNQRKEAYGLGWLSRSRKEVLKLRWKGKDRNGGKRVRQKVQAVIKMPQRLLTAP